jgi:hypothetical protein
LIREDRSPTFWASVCEPGLDLAFLASERVTPLRSDNGGYLFVNLDGLGRVWDLHAAFLPAGWGREASATLKAALEHLGDWQIITSAEVEDNPRSRPPLSFGFRPASGFSGGFRSWFLTRSAWDQSPARRRME